MTLTHIRASENTYDTGISGGTIPLANKQIKVINWVKRLAPYETPLLSSIGMGEEINQDIFYWGQSYQTPQKTVSAEAIDGSETGIDVATGTGLYFNKYNVVMLCNYVAGTNSTQLDLTNKELVWVNQDVTSDTLTVERGYGTSATTHDNGCHVEIVGTAMPQLTDYAITPITRGDQAYNLFQRFQTAAQADRAARKQPNYEDPSDILLADMAEKAKIEKIRMEKAIFYGARKRGIPGTKPDTMGGLDTFIVTNVTDVGGASLSVYAVQNELRDLWKAVGDNGATTFVMGPDTAMLFDTIINPYREATMNDTTANLMLDSVKMRFGTFKIVMHRYCPEGTIYGLNFDHMSIHPFAGRNWDTEEVETQGPYDKMGLSGDFSFKLDAEQTMFKLYGFNIDPDNYQRDGFL